MLIPFYIIDWIFGLDFCRKTSYIDSKHETRGGKMSLYKLSFIFQDIIIRNKGIKPYIKGKMINLKLQEMFDS